MAAGEDMSDFNDEVFYVDDSPDDRMFAIHCHRKGNYRFLLTAFSTGFAAMLDIERRAARSEKLPKLFVVDHYMPVMDGPELIQLVRADMRFSEMLLAVCSGGDDPTDLQTARDAGAQILLQKPLDLDLCRDILDGQFPQ
jgi:CheY-like chemotaxis protein